MPTLPRIITHLLRTTLISKLPVPTALNLQPTCSALPPLYGREPLLPLALLSLYRPRHLSGRQTTPKLALLR